jgi:hypothetical protein
MGRVSKEAVKEGVKEVKEEVESVRKTFGEIEIRKADKREILEIKQILIQGLETKPDLNEV